ncbi:MAG TPA: vanadium-dependent haloperoxidase [Burkholderiaceae bacterium]|nr:vanadium-dependent haloperoxidase [Burkholderiaceae bacterium]
MKSATKSRTARAIAAVFPLLGAAGGASADAVTDWNVKANDIVIEAKLGTPPAIRVMAYAQTAVHRAVAGATKGASLDAAVASANRAVLSKLLPAQQASVDKAYEAALAAIAEGAAKANGVAAGERAAAEVFAQRAKDTIASETYRPYAGPGAYVPTAAVAAPTWSSRVAWVMTSPGQFRVAAPPALTSDVWARDYNEVKDVGSRASTKRTAEQTEIARFWEYSLPAIYHGAVRTVAAQPGRDPVRNARLFAAVAQAMDDAMLAVFDSKYHYNFWRPATAIRNGDIDGNDATAREAAWASLIDAPLHPEYPSAHATLAGAVGAVVAADVGRSSLPELATSSPTAKGATRRWTSVESFAREVAESRIYAGIHYRFSTDAGLALGRDVGELVAARFLAD